MQCHIPHRMRKDAPLANYAHAMCVCATLPCDIDKFPHAKRASLIRFKQTTHKKTLVWPDFRSAVSPVRPSGKVAARPTRVTPFTRVIESCASASILKLSSVCVCVCVREGSLCQGAAFAYMLRWLLVKFCAHCTHSLDEHARRLDA